MAIAAKEKADAELIDTAIAEAERIAKEKADVELIDTAIAEAERLGLR